MKGTRNRFDGMVCMIQDGYKYKFVSTITSRFLCSISDSDIEVSRTAAN